MKKVKEIVSFGFFVVLLCVAAALACHIHMSKANAAEPVLEETRLEQLGYFDPEKDLSVADYKEFQEAVVAVRLESSRQESNSSEKPKKLLLDRMVLESGIEPKTEPETKSETEPKTKFDTEPKTEPKLESTSESGFEVPEWWYDESTREATLTAWAEEGLLTLDWVKNHLLLFYTGEEIRQTTLIVMAEDEVAHSDTVWSAHVWVIVTRVGKSGFENNSSIIGILSARNQFSTYNDENLSKEPNPQIELIVRDVFARKILEDYGLPEEIVGRTMPKTHLFFDDRDSNHFYNEFYRYCWGDIYDPFDSPHNPYDN